MTQRMQTEQPVNAVEAYFRELCAVRAAELPAGTPMIKTIAAVGALDGEFGGNEKDSAIMTQMLRYFLKTGIPIDPAFEVDVVNFRENRDFLAETKQADLVFVAYIIREHVMRVTKCFNTAGGRPDTDLDRLSVTLSPNHREEKWNARAKIAGAKLVLTQGGLFEIGSRSFPDFQPLIDSPTKYGTEKDQITETLQSLHGADADFPTPWIGLAADAAYLKAVAPYIEGSTALGRRMLAVNPSEASLPTQTGLSGLRGSVRALR